jgi:hypothetical protein
MIPLVSLLLALLVDTPHTRTLWEQLRELHRDLGIEPSIPLPFSSMTTKPLVIAQFDDGWSIRQLRTQAEFAEVGTILDNTFLGGDFATTSWQARDPRRKGNGKALELYESGQSQTLVLMSPDAVPVLCFQLIVPGDYERRIRGIKAKQRFLSPFSPFLFARSGSTWNIGPEYGDRVMAFLLWLSDHKRFFIPKSERWMMGQIVGMPDLVEEVRDLKEQERDKSHQILNDVVQGEYQYHARQEVGDLYLHDVRHEPMTEEEHEDRDDRANNMYEQEEKYISEMWHLVYMLISHWFGLHFHDLEEIKTSSGTQRIRQRENIRMWAIQLPRRREEALLLGAKGTNRQLRLHLPMRLRSSDWRSNKVLPTPRQSLFDSWTMHPRGAFPRVGAPELHGLLSDLRDNEYRDAIYWTIEDHHGNVLDRANPYDGRGVIGMLLEHSFLFKGKAAQRNRELDTLISEARALPMHVKVPAKHFNRPKN